MSYYIRETEYDDIQRERPPGLLALTRVNNRSQHMPNPEDTQPAMPPPVESADTDPAGPTPDAVQYAHQVLRALAPNAGKADWKTLDVKAAFTIAGGHKELAKAALATLTHPQIAEALVQTDGFDLLTDDAAAIVLVLMAGREVKVAADQQSLNR